MKRIVLLVIGFLPLALGYLLNYLLYAFPNTNFSVVALIFSFALLITWFLFGKLSVKWIRSKHSAIIYLNLAAILTLLLILYQEIILRQYWPNLLGLSAQYFYLPLLTPAFLLTPMFHSVYSAYICAFILLLVASYIGRIVGERQKKDA